MRWRFWQREPIFLICNLALDGPSHVPGSTLHYCTMCARQVWVSPASLDLMIKKRAKILCISCGVDHATEHGDMDLLLGGAQITELMRYGGQARGNTG